MPMAGSRRACRDMATPKGEAGGLPQPGASAGRHFRV